MAAARSTTRRSRAASPGSPAHAGRRRLVGRGASTPAAASRACSTCAITAIRSSSRCGRWRATATSSAATAGRGVRHVTRQSIFARLGLEKRLCAGKTERFFCRRPLIYRVHVFVTLVVKRAVLLTQSSGQTGILDRMPTNIKVAIAGVWQLRQLTGSGRGILSQPPQRRARWRHAPDDWRLSGQRRRVRLRLRRRQAQGRPAARGGDLRQAEQHARLPEFAAGVERRRPDGPAVRRRRAAIWRTTATTSPSVPRTSSRPISQRPCASRGPRCCCATCRSAPTTP